MAIRKDLDDMLNNLKGNIPEKQGTAEPAGRKSIYDDMSVDDLLNALTVEKKPSLAENILNELDGKGNSAAAEPVPEPEQTEIADVPVQKKKVVITGELPDYEELRRQDMEQMKQERLRAESRIKVISDSNTEPVSVTESESVTDIQPETVEESVDISEEMVSPEIGTEEDHDSEVETEPDTESAPESEVGNSVDKVENESVGRKKRGLFSKRRKRHDDSLKDISDEDVSDEINVSDDDRHEDEFTEESATDLIDAALAAINGTAEGDSDEEDADIVINQEDIPDDEFADESITEENDRVSSLIDDIRENAASAIADLEEHGVDEVSAGSDAEQSAEAADCESGNEQSGQGSLTEDKSSVKKGRVTSALTKILDEDPETLVDVKREKTEISEEEHPKKGKLKRRIYAVLGVVFTIFAIIGIITSAGKGIAFLKSFTSGEMKKDSFTELIYPVVIMDIESFDKPADLTSEQIVTASIWSIIMNDEKLEKYPVNIAGGDVISISAYDVEAEAVSLFGQDHAEFVHTTVGPVNSRFYYDTDKGVYNVPIHPIVFTYEPEIKSIVKSGNKYTITVDYIDERPSWMEKSVSKSVEFHVTEKEDGTYQFDSMNILYVKNNL